MILFSLGVTYKKGDRI